MRVLSFAFFAFVLAGPSFSQTLIERSFIVRAETTTFDKMDSADVHICVLVYPNRQYRLERGIRLFITGRPEVKIYVSTLSEEELGSLEAILNTGKFPQISTNPKPYRVLRDIDFIQLTIPREHGVQRLVFRDSEEQEPYAKDLKPFREWLKQLEKKKQKPSKSEESNNCRTPVVKYSMSPGDKLPDTTP